MPVGAYFVENRHLEIPLRGNTKTGKTKSTGLQNEKYRINNPKHQNEKYKGGAKNARHLLFLHHFDGILDMVNQHLSNV